MSYLVLHIDTEFIAGTVCTGNGNSYPISNDNEDFLWLYFFNNPHQDRISFGKGNKTHYNNKEINYYGRFFDLIENEQETFSIRSIDKKAIELLDYSGILKLLKEKYNAVTHENTEEIPTLITFSLSISELAKQKTVEYLKNHGFLVDSYTIPLSELVCYYPFSRKEYIPTNSGAILLLIATNPTLHLIKLTFSKNYFMVDGKMRTYKGKGIDPRKRALVKFVVSEINKSVGALSTPEEIEDECIRKEQKAEEWLKRIDIQQHNRLLSINESLSIMPNAKRQILIRKNNIEGDTGHYIQDLMDVFDAYKCDSVRGDIDAIFLLGDSFQNSLVKERFERQIDNKKLYIYTNKDIQQILSIYPQIDFKRYIDQEERIKILAEAEKLKQDKQRELEDRKRKEEEVEEQKNAEIIKNESNRKEAGRLYETAIELEKEGKLEDARVNAENAFVLDKTNKEYKQFALDLVEKIKNLNAKNELYKSYLNSAEKYIEDDKWDEALMELENAQTVFDDAEIIKRINEVKRSIKNVEQKKATVSRLLHEIELLMIAEEFSVARIKVVELLSLDDKNPKAKVILSKIDQKLEQKEKERQEKKYKEECAKLIVCGDDYFNNDKFGEALQQYKNALSIYPKDKRIKDKIEQCTIRIKKLEDAFSDLILDANVLEKKGQLSGALTQLEEALKLDPDNLELLSRIKKLKNRIKTDFGDDSKLKEKTNKFPDDVFLPDNSTKKKDDEDVFIKKLEKTIAKEDFLGTSKNKKCDFDKW